MTGVRVSATCTSSARSSGRRTSARPQDSDSSASPTPTMEERSACTRVDSRTAGLEADRAGFAHSFGCTAGEVVRPGGVRLQGPATERLTLEMRAEPTSVVVYREGCPPPGPQRGRAGLGAGSAADGADQPGRRIALEFLEPQARPDWGARVPFTCSRPCLIAAFASVMRWFTRVRLIPSAPAISS